MRTAQQQCKPVLRPWLSRIFMFCRRFAGFLCIYVFGASVFVQLLGFIVILLFFFYFSTYVLFLIGAIEIYDDDEEDDDDNEAQHLHGQSSLRIQTIRYNTDLSHMLLEFTDALMQ